MAWTDTLEARFGRYAIPGMVRGIVVLQVLVFLLATTMPGFADALVLDPVKVMQGQVWRLVTYLFLPAQTSLLFLVFALYITWILGDALEQAWGAFKLNLYIVTGVVFMAAAALVFGAGGDGVVLYTSLFLAFATIYPNFTFLLFFVLPVKVKWLAWLTVGFIIYGCFRPGALPLIASAGAIFATYLLFFGSFWMHHFRHRAEVQARRSRFEAAQIPADEALHRCKTCGRTEASNPELDFRVAIDGEEYCSEHLPTRK